MIRDKRQIYNAVGAGTDDGTTHLLIKCRKEAENPESRFIREVNIAPKFSVLLATSIQLGDLARFCTNPRRFSILSIDTTFNIGKYYVTVAIYRHLMLRSKSAPIGIHPVKIGALFIHHDRKEDSYRRFLLQLKEACSDLSQLQAYGSD